MKTYLKRFKIIIQSNQMGMNPKSLAKIYTQVKGTKLYYDVLIENGTNCCSKRETKL